MLARINRSLFACRRPVGLKRVRRSSLRMEKYSTKTFQDALNNLFTLQSNAAVIQQWQRERRENLQLDLMPEMQAYLAAVGVDVDWLSRRSIHVAGTKGKGTTCAIAESVIRQHGFSTGLYTSPHLVTVRERIKLNGEAISEELFSKYFWICWEALECAAQSQLQPLAMPGWFKYLTVMAYKVFYEEKVDCAVIEVGIGGRTDATNVLTFPACCGITLLDYDHMEVLGNTLAQIAFEKSGIFKAGVPAVTVPQAEEGFRKIVSRAQDLQAPLYTLPACEKYLTASRVTDALGMTADYSKTNATLAITLSQLWLNQRSPHKEHHLPLPDHKSADAPKEFPVFALSELFMGGIRQFHWPGRAQMVDLPDLNMKLYLDGAHTPESVKAALCWFIQNRATTEPVSMIFHCNKPRVPRSLLTPLRNAIFIDKLPVSHIYFTYPKATQPEGDPADLSWQQAIADGWAEMLSELDTMGQLVPVVQVLPSVSHALNQISLRSKVSTSHRTEVMIVGSLYLVGATLEFLHYPTHAKHEQK